MVAPCSHDRGATTNRREVAGELARAQAACAARGHRWTEPRRRVYELLLAAGGPVKAYDLMADFGVERSAKPPTVYRALEFLEAEGFVHRIASLNAFAACGVARAAHAASFLICTCCGSAEEFDPSTDEAVRTAAATRGFHPQTLMLEVRGLCRDCA